MGMQPSTGGAGGPSWLTQNADMLKQMGADLQGQGQQGQQQQDQLLSQLAAMGPPPAVQVPMTAPQGPGASLVGDKYQQMLQAAMRRPPAIQRTRQDAQLNPSVGQLLTQGY